MRLAPSQWRLAAAAATAGIAVTVAFIYHKMIHVKQRNEAEKREFQKEASDAKITPPAPLAVNNIHHCHQQHIPSHLKRELLKEKRRQEKIPDLARKSPMYDNIEMMDPQGQLLATISLKKAHWYIRKQLAKWTIPDTTIQLLFTPKAHSGGGYEKSIKNNICVGCGSDEFHMRHYVVPYAYRTRLPKRYKTHLSHDVVILCPDCHLHCEHETHLRMNALEDARPEECYSASYVDRHLHRIRSAALALLRWKDKLPQDKVEEYDALVRSYLNISSDFVRICRMSSCKMPLLWSTGLPTQTMFLVQNGWCALSSRTTPRLYSLLETGEDTLSILCSRDFYHKDGASMRPSRVM